jgi:hypothetical protein
VWYKLSFLAICPALLPLCTHLHAFRQYTMAYKLRVSVYDAACMQNGTFKDTQCWRAALLLLLLLLQVIKACALVQQSDVAAWVRRLECLLATYTDEYLSLCKARKQQQQQPASGSAASGKSPKLLLLPTAAKSGIIAWFKHQLQQPGSADAAAGDAASQKSRAEVEDGAATAALSQMKYFLLNAPLAKRVCMASNDSQVSPAVPGCRQQREAA